MLAVAAAASFAGAFLLTRDARVGPASTPSGASPASSSQESDPGASDFFGDGAIAPADGASGGSAFVPSAPDVRTGVS
jgi:hypothetical protein